MSCYARGPVCPYECMPCDECPASKPEYAEAFEVTHNSDAMKVKEKTAMENVKYIPCYEEACKQIEVRITHYMRHEDWCRIRSDIWAFWRTMRCFIVCENEVAILEEMYDSKMGSFNKAKVSKKNFVAYMMHSDIIDCYCFLRSRIEKGCYLFDIILQECKDKRFISEITIGSIVTRTMETGEILYRCNFTESFFNLYGVEKKEIIKRWCSSAQEKTKMLNDFFATDF